MKRVYYRLCQNWGGLPAGSCISEDKYGRVYYLDKVLFQPYTEDEIEGMIKHEDADLCVNLGIDFLIFYTPLELEFFLNKESYAV